MKTEAELPYLTQIKFNIIPGMSKTWTDPGCDAELEVIELKIFDEEISQALQDKILEKLKSEIEEVCEDQAMENYAADQVDEADYRRDMLEDR